MNETTHGDGFTLRIHNMYLGRTRKKKTSKEMLLTWPTTALPWTAFWGWLLLFPSRTTFHPSSHTQLPPSPRTAPENSSPELPLLDSSHLTAGQGLSHFLVRILKISGICAVSLIGLKDLWWQILGITLRRQSTSSLQNQPIVLSFQKRKEAIAKHLCGLVTPDEPKCLPQYNSKHVLGTLPSFPLSLCTEQSWSRWAFPASPCAF